MKLKTNKIATYISNCFLLLIPIFIWNILFANSLPKGYSPEFFWNDIPPIVSYSENALRIIVFIIPTIMVLSLKTKLQKTGLIIFLAGMLIYFTSWFFQIYDPASEWSQSLLGFMAPAYTTIIWFVGIGLIGNKAFIRIPYLSAIYIGFSILFVFFHSWHTYIIFQRF